MHFQTTSSNPDIPIPYDIRIDGIPLHRKDYTKFLGITIDKQLTWSQHIADHIITNGQIGILYRIKHLLSQKSLHMLYNTLILP